MTRMIKDHYNLIHNDKFVGVYYVFDNHTYSYSVSRWESDIKDCKDLLAQMGLLKDIESKKPVAAIEAMMPKLDSIMTSLNILLADPALRQMLHNVEGMTDNLNATSRDLRTLSASLNREMPTMMQKANGVLDNTQQLTGNLAAIDAASMMAGVNQTLANVNEMTRKLNSNEGTLGLLMRDPTLYNNMAATMASADSLMIDLKAHPKRYVHFSIFGKKDK